MGSVAAVSAGGQAFGSIGNAYSTSQSQKMQGDFQRAQYEENAKFAKIQAEDAITRGDEASNEQVKKTKKLLGSEVTAAAASGVDVNSGSVKQIQNETETLGALDALTIKNNAWKEAWGYKAQALQMSSQGAFAQMAGNNAAANTLLTGGMQAIGYAGSAAYYYNSDGDKTTKNKVG